MFNLDLSLTNEPFPRASLSYEYLVREREGLQDVEEMTASGPRLSIVRVIAKKATKKPYVSATARSCP